jgi:ketosteroid isomerase-like protein
MAAHRMTANAESLAIKKPAWGRKMQQRPMRKGERTMKRTIVSRRNLLVAGGCTLAGGVLGLRGVASAPVLTGQSMTNEEIIRKWYKAWEKKDWGPVDSLLADNFTFTSAAGDDHISKSTFKARCWETQIDFIQHFDLERITTDADDAFVKYLCHTKNGKSFRNVEYLRIRNGKLESMECYFGAQASFPSAVSAGQQ